MASPGFLNLEVRGSALTFQAVELKFLDSQVGAPPWSLKNNKTLRATLEHPKYSKFRSQCAHYEPHFDQPLGEFLLSLQQQGDDLYRRFLNPDGDLSFGRFVLGNLSIKALRGLYCYRLNEELVYVGRCLDSFDKRINQGYGNIHPKNCYLDGQRTNCRLNHLITANKDEITFYVCPMTDNEEIARLESLIIQSLKPKWNK